MIIHIKPYWAREDGYFASAVALIMAGVAAATSAAGSMASASAQKQASQFNSQVAQNNADAATQQALANAQRIQEAGRRTTGRQVATMAAAGVDPNSGSGSAVTYDSKVQNELDQLTTVYKGQVAAGEQQGQSTLDTFQGQSAERAGAIHAGGTLLSGAGMAVYNYGSVANNPRFGSNEDYAVD